MDGLSFIVVRTVRLPNSVCHEGPGSILSYIENKGWAYGLSADADPVCPGTPGRFVVKIQLSDEGLERYPEIVKVFFQYLSLLLETGPQKQTFEEIKKMAEINFKFKEKGPVSEFVQTTSSYLQEPISRQSLLGSPRFTPLRQMRSMRLCRCSVQISCGCAPCLVDILGTGIGRRSGTERSTSTGSCQLL
jgi:hypothetical protein